MTYNFDIKPTKRFVKDVCEWLEQHIDKYTLTDEPDKHTNVLTSQTGGKTAVVKFSKQGVSVEADEDILEYIQKRVSSSYRHLPEIDRSAKAKFLRVGVSLIFYIFGMNAYLWVAGIIEDLIFKLTGDFFTALTVFLTWTLYILIFLLTFKPIYKKEGERNWRTVFIQSGGIFTVLHIVFLIMIGIAHDIYKAVKESFVIPNFTVEQIEHGRRIYNDISDTAFTPFAFYVIFVLVPLIIVAVAGRYYVMTSDLKEIKQIETLQTERN